MINRDAGLASPGLDAEREKTVLGTVRLPYLNPDAQHSRTLFCHFSTATADPNLEGIAKTVLPREKSFISAISRFQIPEQPLDMNDVRGQEMSENTLLSFQKSVFRV